MTSVESDGTAFYALLEYLQRTRGFDFTAYKRSSLIRRVSRRMQTVGIEGYGDYLDYLQVHPEEFSLLFNTILINVTTFFRDETVWTYIAEQVIPQLLASKSARESVRVWSAGAASGEEAYTLAMLLAEALGVEAFRNRVKIYATDVDEEALNEARAASYTHKQVEKVPEALMRTYFEHSNGRFIFNKDRRRSVIFGRHDLIQDAPISRIDLLTCRNTLMYFNAEAQSKILSRFSFAVNEGGYLVLGKAEMLLSRINTFTPVEMKRRIFQRQPLGNGGERSPAQTQNYDDAALLPELALRDAAFEVDTIPQLVVDTSGVLLLANEPARELFGIGLSDSGRPFRDLEISYRPVELRSLVERALSERQVVLAREAEWSRASGLSRYLDVYVMPLSNPLGTLLGVKVMFHDVTRYKRLQEELQHSHVELETANEELQSANEELETTNEELQSTVEELETTNEELQSTNEELETMNEELQSTNEELEATNEQMRQRGAELNQLNVFLKSILASLRDGVIVVDGELRVQAWNPHAEELWGLRADEVRGRHLLNLDIGLPVDELKQPIRACVNGTVRSTPLTLNAINRRGKPITVRVTCTALVADGETHHGVILFID